MAEYVIALTEDEADLSAIVRGLVDFNASRVEPGDWRHVVLALRDAGHALHGGLVGYTHWGWLFVSHLWVAQQARGLGFGRALMARAEREALSHGCAHAHLDTYDFQARGFYERLGYTVFAQLDDYPPGHARYFLRKDLSREAR